MLHDRTMVNIVFFQSHPVSAAMSRELTYAKAEREGTLVGNKRSIRNGLKEKPFTLMSDLSILTKDDIRGFD